MTFLKYFGMFLGGVVALSCPIFLFFLFLIKTQEFFETFLSSSLATAGTFGVFSVLWAVAMTVVYTYDFNKKKK